jgi:hypothetical protein
MKVPLLVLVLGALLSAGPATAWRHDRDTTSRFILDDSQPKHPKSWVVAVPVTEPIVGREGSPLSFRATYMTLFRSSDDARNGKGKVVLNLQVVRNDQVVWRKQLKDKVKDDWETSQECGNCTHKLRACRAYKGSLMKGDVVLFEFSFSGMPDFAPGESAQVDASVRTDADACR